MKNQPARGCRRVSGGVVRAPYAFRVMTVIRGIVPNRAVVVSLTMEQRKCWRYGGEGQVLARAPIPVFVD